MNWPRSTPTAPFSVVVEHAASNTAAAIVPRRPVIRTMCASLLGDAFAPRSPTRPRRGTRSYHPPEDPRLFVERRGVAELCALRLVVVDPQLRLALIERGGDALQRRQRLLLVDVHLRHALVRPVVLEVHGVARQHDDAGLRQAHEQ